ncbi:helicase-related protein [Streptomyces sp. NPDC049541]|uniref:helicase-related protein n=1 Tax=Streptomyces sp. NPDC049541 TaxID=3365594 RepID=UPI0037A05519
MSSIRHSRRDLNPTVLHEKVTARARRAALAALADRSCRIVVCVDMLGEGFDLPALKIAALHDVKKSLSPMIQVHRAVHPIHFRGLDDRNRLGVRGP